MKTLGLFGILCGIGTVGTAQVEKDDAHQVQIEYSRFSPQVCQECVGSSVNVPTIFEVHGEQGLRMEVENVKEVHWMVFDKKGAKLFEGEISVLYNDKTDIRDGKRVKVVDAGWNGRYQNQLLPEDMYVYTINAITTDDKKIKGNGFVQLDITN